MYLIYQIVITLAVLIASPFLALKALFGGHGLAERLGVWDFQSDNRRVIWFHAASMGELKVVHSILQKLQIDQTKFRLVFTSVTRTGKNLACKLFAEHDIFYLPLDVHFIINRIVKRVKPAVLVLAETEIWPGLIRSSTKVGSKIGIVNGRISEKSYSFYKMFKALTSPAIQKIDTIMTQTESDRERFVNLGANPENCQTFGNTKFDQLINENPNNIDADLKAILTAWSSQFLFIAGSVHKGEFKPVIQAVKSAIDKYIAFKAIIAPRHMKDVSALESVLDRSSLNYTLRTKLNNPDSGVSSVILLNSMGELGGLYGYADLAFVGGSLVEIGGHDPLEPAAAKCYVCFGPHMNNCRLFADTLIDTGGASYTGNADELAKLIINMATTSPRNSAARETVYSKLVAHTGVSEKIAVKLNEIIDELAD